MSLLRFLTGLAMAAAAVYFHRVENKMNNLRLALSNKAYSRWRQHTGGDFHL